MHKKLLYRQIPNVRDQFMKKQKAKCPICKTLISDPCLDHDHKTGAVRDVLCRNCNGLEGRVFNLCVRGKRAGTEADFLRSILKYWNKHKENKTKLIHPKFGAKRRKKR